MSSRGGKAVRLTYDHKGSDTQEAKRIMDAGGFVMNNRVNGELYVTLISEKLTNRCSRSDEISRRCIHEGIRSRSTLHYRNDPRSIG
jgi:serine/threonine protein phosphatase PrpC